MLPKTATRVNHATDEAINRRIRKKTARRLRHYAARPDRIDARLAELDLEWDTERVLEANASALAFFGTFMGMAVARRYLVLPAAVSAFLFQHAVQGWCPPLPVIRALGVRTQREIDEERYALKALRGDFGPLGPGPGEPDSRAAHAYQAVRL